MEKDQKKALLYGLAAVLLWSTVASAFKLSLRYFDSSQLLLYASLASCVTLFVIVLIQKKLYLLFSYTTKEYFFLFILGMISPFMYYLVLFKAYSLLPAQEAQALNYTWALTLSYLSVFILHHKLRKADIIAGLLCYFGVIIISTHGNLLSFSFSNTQGVVLALFSTLLWSLYWLYSTKLKVDPIVGLFINFIVALPFIFLWTFLFSDPFTFNPYGLMGALYIGVFEMGVTFVLLLNAMKLSTNASSVANLIFLSPFISLFFIHFFVGEEILVSTLVGLGFIILGLLVQQQGHKMPKVKN